MGPELKGRFKSRQLLYLSSPSKGVLMVAARMVLKIRLHLLLGAGELWMLPTLVFRVVGAL